MNPDSSQQPVNSIELIICLASSTTRRPVYRSCLLSRCRSLISISTLISRCRQPLAGLQAFWLRSPSHDMLLLPPGIWNRYLLHSLFISLPSRNPRGGSAVWKSLNRLCAPLFSAQRPPSPPLTALSHPRLALAFAQSLTFLILPYLV